MKGKTVEYWKTVVFTDESKIKISGSDGCVFVWRKSTEEWLPCCTLGTVKTGQPSLMIWVCMSYVGVGPLAIVNGSVTCAKYRRILQKHFLLLVAERQRRGKATIARWQCTIPSSQCSNILEKQSLPRIPWMASTKSWSLHNREFVDGPEEGN